MKRYEEISPSNTEPLPESLSRWTGHLLYWVTSLAGEVYAKAMATIGLESEQVGILSILEAEGPMVQARLSERTRIDKATMVGLLNGLEAQKLIERRPHPSDRRAYEVHLLDAGRERLKRAEGVNAAVTQQFFAALKPQERKTLHALLSRLATSNAPTVRLEVEEASRLAEGRQG